MALPGYKVLWVWFWFPSIQKILKQNDSRPQYHFHYRNYKIFVHIQSFDKHVDAILPPDCGTIAIFVQDALIYYWIEQTNIFLTLICLVIYMLSVYTYLRNETILTPCALLRSASQIVNELLQYIFIACLAPPNSATTALSVNADQTSIR